MKALYFDCFAGISGDMTLGAFVDLGVNFDQLVAELKKLGLENEYRLEMKKADKHGIYGTKVDVVDLNKEHYHHHDHDHDHGHHHHVGLRDYSDIKQIIENSTLSDKVKKVSLDIFEKIAVAEAKIHGKTVESVHFHEVGAIDSIIDVVGTAICYTLLGVEAVMGTSVEVGSGFVRCDHGLMPIPAPATTEILMGIPIKSHVKGMEMTTPTGAAILKTLVNEFVEGQEFSIEKVGYGLGTRELEIPNLLRLMIVDVRAKKKSDQWMIETNIDDMTPEMLVFAEERLLKSGALDVFKTPIIMKKGRPAIKLSILSSEEKCETIKRVLFQETSAIGLRMYPVKKTKLERSYETFESSLGEVVLKTAYLDGKIINEKLEYENCRKIAMDKNMPIKAVYKTIELEMSNRKDKK